MRLLLPQLARVWLPPRIIPDAARAHATTHRAASPIRTGRSRAGAYKTASLASTETPFRRGLKRSLQVNPARLLSLPSQIRAKNCRVGSCLPKKTSYSRVWLVALQEA